MFPGSRTAAAPQLRYRVAEASAALVDAVQSRVVATVLTARGVATPQQLERGLVQLLAPSTLPGANEAALLIARAIAERLPICIIGDYDADGATSTALAVSGLRAFGATNVSYLVPERVRDGYGLGVPLVERAAVAGARLLITVDNGIGSIDGVAAARARGIDVIVTDHHLPGATLPDANVLVNPNLPGSPFGSGALAGVGVIFYVLLALRAVLRADPATSASASANLADWLDLVALGTVADLVPLDANNRVLVHQGLQRMRAGRARPGVRALLRIANRRAERLTEIDIGFAIAPRLNAAGRLADMSVGVRCLLAESDAEADLLAQELDAINVERRGLSEAMTLHAASLLDAALALRPHAVCLYDDAWHEGIVGIVAGRMRELAQRPAFAFAAAREVGNDGRNVLKGSGRSVPGVNLRDLLVDIDRAHPGLLLRYGGHAMAAGVTLSPARLQPFQAALNAAVHANFGDAGMDECIDCDGGLSDGELSLATALGLELRGPWGNGFPAPRFHDVFEVVHARGLTPRFHRLVLRRGERLLDATCNAPAPAVGATCDCLYGLEVNRHRQTANLELRIERWWPSARASH